MAVCDIPRKCENCGYYITEEEVVSYKCNPTCGCDYCYFNLTERCPICGNFLHCGACV